MKNISLKKSDFENIQKTYEMRTEEVEVPEFNDMLNLEKDQVAVVKIQQLNLDDYLKIQNTTNDNFRNIVDGIVAASVDKDEVKDEVLYHFNELSPMTKYNIELVLKGVIEPKLNRSDIISLKDLFPNVIIRIASRIIELTNKGGLKKKSIV